MHLQMVSLFVAMLVMPKCRSCETILKQTTCCEPKAARKWKSQYTYSFTGLWVYCISNISTKVARCGRLQLLAVHEEPFMAFHAEKMIVIQLADVSPKNQVQGGPLLLLFQWSELTSMSRIITEKLSVFCWPVIGVITNPIYIPI